MKGKETTITIHVLDPTGKSQSVTTPHDVNTQQFIDALVTVLGLPVIGDNEAGISYQLLERRLGTPVDGLATLRENEVHSGQLLTLTGVESIQISILDQPAKSSLSQIEQLQVETEDNQEGIRLRVAEPYGFQLAFSRAGDSTIAELVHFIENAVRLPTNLENGDQISYRLRRLIDAEYLADKKRLDEIKIGENTRFRLFPVDKLGQVIPFVRLPNRSQTHVQRWLASEPRQAYLEEVNERVRSLQRMEEARELYEPPPGKTSLPDPVAATISVLGILLAIVGLVAATDAIVIVGGLILLMGFVAHSVQNSATKQQSDLNDDRID